jgi:osmotically-inducible protein OsmY
MADYNRNRDQYSTDENWDQNQDRNYRQNDYNQNSYNNANYGRESDWRNMNRDREYNTQNYGSTSYGNTGAVNYNNTGAYGGGGYGMYPDDYNNRTARSGGNYGNYGDEYGASDRGYGRQDWGRANVDTGMNYHNDNRRNWGDNDMGYGSDYGGRYRAGHGYAGDYNTGYYGAYNNRNYDNDWQRTSGRNQYGNMGRNMYENDYRNMNRGRNGRDWWDRTRDEVSSWFGDDDAERRRRMDRMYTGSYRGKGPKDYHRSEDRIREDVCDRLTDDDMLDATNIQVQVQGDNVILSGTVNNRNQKRRAEDLVEAISGVRDVENRIRVEHGSDYYSSTGSDQAGTTNEIIRNSGNEKKNK